MTRLGLRILTVLAVWALAGGSLSAAEAGATDDSKAVAASINDFGIALYSSLAEDNEDGNLFFSPFSISTALAMTYAGARGDTADEMKSALRLDLDSTQTHLAYKRLIDGLNAQAPRGGVTLSVANALWGQKGYKFRRDFVTLVKDNYGAGLETVDFARSEAARKTINDWVAGATRDRIKDLIPGGAISNLTHLVLTNAVYFKGDWVHQFDANDTREGPFTLADGSKVRPQMMRQTGRFRYGEWPDLQALDMPYKGGELSMTILLPKEADGLALLEAMLTPEALDETLAALKTEEVAIAIPKVKFTQSFSLVEALRYMGMEGAFTERRRLLRHDRQERLVHKRSAAQDFRCHRRARHRGRGGDGGHDGRGSGPCPGGAEALHGEPPVSLPHPRHEDRGDTLHGEGCGPDEMTLGAAKMGCDSGFFLHSCAPMSYNVPTVGNAPGLSGETSV